MNAQYSLHCTIRCFKFRHGPRRTPPAVQTQIANVDSDCRNCQWFYGWIVSCHDCNSTTLQKNLSQNPGGCTCTPLHLPAGTHGSCLSIRLSCLTVIFWYACGTKTLTNSCFYVCSPTVVGLRYVMPINKRTFDWLIDLTDWLIQNTIDSCMNPATGRRGYLLKHMFTKLSKITQCNGHYTVQGHSRSPILVPMESSYTNSY